MKILVVALALSASVAAQASLTWTESLEVQSLSNVWWKETSAFVCHEGPKTEVPKWGTCKQAVAAGGCTKTDFSVREICCKSCCVGDASDMTMVRTFGPGASCKAAGEKGYCTKNHDIKHMCCKTCPQHISAAVAAEQQKKAFDPRKVKTGSAFEKFGEGNSKSNNMMDFAKALLKKHGKNVDATTPPNTIGTVWWKLPSAFKCQETPKTVVPKWGSCPDAAAQGGCTSTDFSIQELCCRTCCLKDKSDADMQEAFGPGASCKAAGKKGYCTKNHDIKRMCCKTCQQKIQDEFGEDSAWKSMWDVPKKPAASQGVCGEATNAQMEQMMGVKGVSCANAKSHGACQHDAIQKVCCKTCSTAKAGGSGATSGTGVSCADVTAQEMEKTMGQKGVSCRDAARQGACKHDKIKSMCCKSCMCKADATVAAMEKAFAKGANCPHAAENGACKNPKIKAMCCKSCAVK